MQRKTRLSKGYNSKTCGDKRATKKALVKPVQGTESFEVRQVDGETLFPGFSLLDGAEKSGDVSTWHATAATTVQSRGEA
jgi:hypothetical protein